MPCPVLPCLARHQSHQSCNFSCKSLKSRHHALRQRTSCRLLGHQQQGRTVKRGKTRILFGAVRQHPLPVAFEFQPIAFVHLLGSQAFVGKPPPL